MQKIKLLVDLKPALDGFAGIPQETRLLFSNLRKLDEPFLSDGLLQHGSGYLTSRPGVERLPANERVIHDSRTVVSFCRNAVKTYVPGLPKYMQRYIALQILRWQTMRGQACELGVFETSMFDDFLWRHLFSKSLPLEDMERVTRARYRIINHSRKHFHNVGLKSKKQQYPSVVTDEYDFLIAQTPFPAHVSPRTKLVVRYHDAIPVLMPHTISDVSFHQASHYRALETNVRDGALFACVSEQSRQDLLKMFPEVEHRSVTIHNMISGDFWPSEDPADRVRDILASRQADPELGPSNPAHGERGDGERGEGDDYLLMISTLEPRKNHALLVSAWERLRHTTNRNLKLVIVGGKGWNYEPILNHMRPWIARGELFHLQGVSNAELRLLYSHAAATICPSFAEGFDYSGIEAMRCGGLVAASDIPVHREVFEGGAVYFSAYSVDEATRVIGDLLADEAKAQRQSMREAARHTLKAYETETLLSQWQDFLLSR
nr:glycosyltransferase family 1 protein [uncultured Cohaesibacter sp.]